MPQPLVLGLAPQPMARGKPEPKVVGVQPRHSRTSEDATDPVRRARGPLTGASPQRGGDVADGTRRKDVSPCRI